MYKDSAYSTKPNPKLSAFLRLRKKKQKKNFSLYMCMSKKEVLSDLAQVQICPQNTVDTI